MALSRALFLFAFIATIFSTMAVAKDFVVGDEKGWTTLFDYQTWTANKVFRLGDTLTFNYVGGKDNVVRVNGSDFKSCSVPLTAPVLTSGQDKIIITTYGRRWYISSVTDHCENGQKLFITVQPKQDGWSPVPSPSPSPSLDLVTPEAPPSNAPWPASSVPRRSLLPKKLFQIFNRD
ncbi:plastocyanin-like domain protein [Medicago truncatula]|uniref:Plastocyanin-like domain protein n=2 Tax=Medicago truncatula TaxID=3880 RepID=G7L0I1_MEDTR|nr:plastocyanin-like domain protein [Medicago truncatula]